MGDESQSAARNDGCPLGYSRGTSLMRRRPSLFYWGPTLIIQHWDAIELCIVWCAYSQKYGEPTDLRGVKSVLFHFPSLLPRSSLCNRALYWPDFY